jgi:phage I-like protein
MEREVKLVLEAADLPEWIRLLPLGRVDLVDGRAPFEVDRESLAVMVEAFQARGMDLVVDYEHQSLNGGRAPAAGWIKDLAVREDGLWARVEWTAQAREYLRQKEYRYFSPVLKLDPETRKPLNLLHVALTNVPAMQGVNPLVAKYGGGGAGTSLGEGSEDRDVSGESGELKELFREITGALGLAEDVSPAQAKGHLEALKTGAAQAEGLAAELAALKSRLAREQASRAVEGALLQGKISPAQKDWAMAYCRQDLESFQAFVAKAPKVVPVGEILPIHREASDEKGRLTPEELAVCRAAHISPAEYLRAKSQIDQAK